MMKDFNESLTNQHPVHQQTTGGQSNKKTKRNQTEPGSTNATNTETPKHTEFIPFKSCVTVAECPFEQVVRFSILLKKEHLLRE